MYVFFHGSITNVVEVISLPFFTRLHLNWPLTLKSGLESSILLLVVLPIRYIWLWLTLAPRVDLEWTSCSVKSSSSDFTQFTTLPTTRLDWRQQASPTLLPTNLEIIRYVIYTNVKWYIVSGCHSFDQRIYARFFSLSCHFVSNWHYSDIFVIPYISGPYF